MTKIHQVGAYAITTEHDRITNFQLVETIGGYLPKIGESFTDYCAKVRISPIDITPRMKDEVHPLFQQIMKPFIGE